MLNPFNWLKAKKYAKQSEQYEKSDFDLELYLYSKILTNNMLHYGYFEDVAIAPEDLSIKMVEDAQINYSKKLMEHIVDQDNSILDVGCGMGGFSLMLNEAGYKVESVTPNNNQVEFITKNYKQLTVHKARYQDFKADKKFGTVINSESLQYIPLEEAFAKTESLITDKARWIIIDYFNCNENNRTQKPHNLHEFKAIAEKYNWNTVYEQDVTPNILPTLKFVDMYVKRFLDPVKHYAYEKLRFKKPKLYFMTEGLRGSIDQKIEKETKLISPEWFLNNREYRLIVLEK